MNASKILTSFDNEALPLRNRLAVAPMTRISATVNGYATPSMATYYERFAQGGFGLVITEGIYTDQAFSQGYPGQPGIADETQARAWQGVTERIHAHKGLAIAQLMHAGAQSQFNRFTDITAGPSAVQPKGEKLGFYDGQGAFPVPRAMSEEDIQEAIAGFARAAQLAMDTAGFDGVEIHGANGYLVDQFLTDYTNQRNDRFGGNTRGRMTLMREVIKAVRQAVGDRPVGVRISQGKVTDFAHKWAGGEADARNIFGALQEAGVDFIHITEHRAWEPAFPGGQDSLVKLAHRYAPNTMLIANGKLHEEGRADGAISEGADVVALGQAALANPDLPHKLAHQRPLVKFDGSLLSPLANIKESEL